MIHFCLLKRLKTLHFISTMSVFPKFYSKKCEESFVVEDSQIFQDGTGYSQSKRVAERLVYLSHQKGLPCAIYRPVTICKHSLFREQFFQTRKRDFPMFQTL